MYVGRGKARTAHTDIAVGFAHVRNCGSIVDQQYTWK